MTRYAFEGAVAIVTGGSRGIGPYIAAALAQRGARVALVARSQPELDAVARTLREDGGEVLAIAADVTSAADRHRIVETTERLLGPIGLLVKQRWRRPAAGIPQPRRARHPRGPGAQPDQRGDPVSSRAPRHAGP